MAITRDMVQRGAVFAPGYEGGIYTEVIEVINENVLFFEKKSQDDLSEKTTPHFLKVLPMHTFIEFINPDQITAWKPKTGDDYYIPCISEEGGYEFDIFDETSELDYFRLKHGLVFKTKEEAIAKQKEIIRKLNEF